MNGIEQHHPNSSNMIIDYIFDTTADLKITSWISKASLRVVDAFLCSTVNFSKAIRLPIGILLQPLSHEKNRGLSD